MTYCSGYSWNSFTVIDENEIRTDSNFSRGDSFTYEGADATMYVYDNDWGLAGDSGGRNNEVGSDWQPGWLNEDGTWTEAGNVYWEGYFVLRGSDGQYYYLIEIEATQLADGGNDHFAFYGRVPPLGTELTAVCYYGDCGSLSYNCLTGGELRDDATPPDAIDDVLNVSADEVDGDQTDINVLLNDVSNTSEALIVKGVDGQAALVGVWIDLPDGGRIMVAADGSVDFDADGDFDALAEGETATVSIDYTVENSDGLQDTATLRIIVTGINDAPVAVDQCVRTTEDEAVTGNVMTGAFDVDGDEVFLDSISIGAIGETIAVTTAAGYSGFVTVNADGSFTYTPGDDAQAMNTGDTDSFTFEFTVKSQNGTTTVDSTRTIDFETGGIVVTYADGRGNPGNDKPVGSVGEDPNGTGEEGNGTTVGNSDGFGVDGTTTSGGGVLVAGDVITSQIAGFTITVNAYGKAGKYDEAMIFDTNNPTGGDTDLATDTQNNVLIISEDGLSSDPDDNAKGGEITFHFDEPTDVKSLTLIDNEEGAWIIFIDENGNETGKTFVPGGADGSIMVVPLDGQDVSKMIVALCGSGALDDLVIGSTEEVPAYLYDTATVTVKIDGLSDNLPPVVQAETNITDENTPVSGNLLDDATDPDGDVVTLESVTTGPLGEAVSVTTDGGRTGTLVVNADGSYTFTPDGVDLDLGQTDTISFGFTATDGQETASSTATITITGLNEGPVAVAQILSTTEANTQGIASSVSGNLLDGATDAEGDAISLASTTLGTIGQTVAVTTDGGRSGTLTINADGSFTFTSTDDSLDLGQSDTLTFDFTVQSSGGVTVQSSTATATVNINGVNVAPVSIDQSYSIAEANDQGLAASVTGNLLDGATDADGDAISLFSTSLGAIGETVAVTTANGVAAELTVNADGTFTLTALDSSMDLTESDSVVFDFTVVSSGGVTAQYSTSTATVTIEGVNVGPVAADVSGSIFEQNSAGLENSFTGDLFLNASDADGDALTLASTTLGAIGSTVSVVTTKGNTGLLTINSDGTFTFVSTSGDLDQGEEDSLVFDFTVSSTGGAVDQTATATATIAITGVNFPPVAIDQFYTTDEDTSLSTGSILEGSSDVDGDVVTLSGLGSGLVISTSFRAPVVNQVTTVNGLTGELVVFADGTLRYTPSAAAAEAMAEGDVDTFTFEYTVESNDGGLIQYDTAQVVITITGADEVIPNTPPVAVSQVIRIDETEIASGDLSALVSDSDAGDVVSIDAINGTAIGTALSLELTSATNGWTGTLTVNPDGSFTFDPSDQFLALNNGQQETVSFTYTASDLLGETATATIDIIVDGISDAPPPAADVNYYFLIDTSFTMFVEVPGLDCDANGDGVNTWSDLSIELAAQLGVELPALWAAFSSATISTNYYTFGSNVTEVSSPYDITSDAASTSDLAGALVSLQSELDATKDNRVYVFTGNGVSSSGVDAAVDALVNDFNVSLEAYNVGPNPGLLDGLLNSTLALLGVDTIVIDDCTDVPEETINEQTDLYFELFEPT